MSDQLASVYGLKDPRNSEIFYIGMSTDPYARYGQHLAFRVARNAKEDRILDMREEELMPELIIFERNIPITEAPDHEQYWIHFYLEQEIALTNIQHARNKNNSKKDQKIPKYSLSEVHGVYEHACRSLARHLGRCDECSEEIKCDDYQAIQEIRDKWRQTEKVMLWKQGGGIVDI